MVAEKSRVRRLCCLIFIHMTTSCMISRRERRMTLHLPWQIQKRKWKTRRVIFVMMEWHAHERKDCSVDNRSEQEEEEDWEITVREVGHYLEMSRQETDSQRQHQPISSSLLLAA